MHHWLVLEKVQWNDAFTKSASIQYGEKKNSLLFVMWLAHISRIFLIELLLK